MFHMTENEMVMCSFTIKSQCDDYYEPLQMIPIGWSFNKQVVKENEILIVVIPISWNKQHDFGLWKVFKSSFIYYILLFHHFAQTYWVQTWLGNGVPHLNPKDSL